MKKELVALIASISFLSGCFDLTDNSDEFVEHVAAVLSQCVASKSASFVSFLTRASWTNSSGSFPRAEISRIDTTFAVP